MEPGVYLLGYSEADISSPLSPGFPISHLRLRSPRAGGAKLPILLSPPFFPPFLLLFPLFPLALFALFLFLSFSPSVERDIETKLLSMLACMHGAAFHRRRAGVHTRCTIAIARACVYTHVVNEQAVDASGVRTIKRQWQVDSSRVKEKTGGQKWVRGRGKEREGHARSLRDRARAAMIAKRVARTSRKFSGRRAGPG